MNVVSDAGRSVRGASASSEIPRSGEPRKGVRARAGTGEQEWGAELYKQSMTNVDELREIREIAHPTARIW